MANTTSTLKRKLRKGSLINLATTVASFLVGLFETVTSGCQLRASGAEKEERPIPNHGLVVGFERGLFTDTEAIKNFT